MSFKVYKQRTHFNLKCDSGHLVKLTSTALNKRLSRLKYKPAGIINRRFELTTQYATGYRVDASMSLADLYRLYKAIGEVLESKANYYGMRRLHQAVLTRKTKKLVKYMHATLTSLAGEGKL